MRTQALMRTLPIFLTFAVWLSGCGESFKNNGRANEGAVDESGDEGGEAQADIPADPTAMETAEPEDNGSGITVKHETEAVVIERSSERQVDLLGDERYDRYELSAEERFSAPIRYASDEAETELDTEGDKFEIPAALTVEQMIGAEESGANSTGLGLAANPNLNNQPLRYGVVRRCWDNYDLLGYQIHFQYVDAETARYIDPLRRACDYLKKKFDAKATAEAVHEELVSGLVRDRTPGLDSAFYVFGLAAVRDPLPEGFDLVSNAALHCIAWRMVDYRAKGDQAKSDMYRSLEGLIRTRLFKWKVKDQEVHEINVTLARTRENPPNFNGIMVSAAVLSCNR